MIKLIYWSGTGNTANMAKYIAEGIGQGNKEVDVKEVANASKEDLEEAELIILGCPAMGSEEIDDTEMLPFIEEAQEVFNGKKIALFGSYGWGGGEWMEIWKEQMEGFGANVITEPLVVNEFTKGQDEEICTQYGRALVG